MRSRAISGRPQAGEYAPYVQNDIDAVASDDAVAALMTQRDEVTALYGRWNDKQVAGVAYVAGKWTVKEILGHLSDDERIYAYRALCLARGEPRELPGFDEEVYARNGGFESCPLKDLLAEYVAVREATITLLRNLPPEAWSRRGVVNGFDVTVRGLAFHIAGHELHHLRVLRTKYLPLLEDA